MTDRAAIAAAADRAKALLEEVRELRADFHDDRMHNAFDCAEEGLSEAILHLGRTSWLPIETFAEAGR